MLPGSVDPRRPDKQQRYKPPPASNNAAPGEDLTPDYMNILDPQRKSMHPSNRSDRFKVVKIESTEPFKRGRWKCMDFLDQSYSKIFQQNNIARPVNSPNRSPSPKTANLNTATSNANLQSSMLKIFYRQNSNSEMNSHCSCSTSLQNESELKLICSSDCLNEKHKYQNHVLIPGMVSSSLRGVKYPLELNFINDDSTKELQQRSTSAFSQQNKSTHKVCSCKNETKNTVNNLVFYHQNMSSDHIKANSTQQFYSQQVLNDPVTQNSISSLNITPISYFSEDSFNESTSSINNVPPHELGIHSSLEQSNQQIFVNEELLVNNLRENVIITHTTDNLEPMPIITNQESSNQGIAQLVNSQESADNTQINISDQTIVLTMNNSIEGDSTSSFEHQEIYSQTNISDNTKENDLVQNSPSVISTNYQKNLENSFTYSPSIETTSLQSYISNTSISYQNQNNNINITPVNNSPIQNSPTTSNQNNTPRTINLQIPNSNYVYQNTTTFIPTNTTITNANNSLPNSSNFISSSNFSSPISNNFCQNQNFQSNSPNCIPSNAGQSTNILPQINSNMILNNNNQGNVGSADNNCTQNNVNFIPSSVHNSPLQNSPNNTNNNLIQNVIASNENNFVQQTVNISQNNGSVDTNFVPNFIQNENQPQNNNNIHVQNIVSSPPNSGNFVQNKSPNNSVYIQSNGNNLQQPANNMIQNTGNLTQSQNNASPEKNCMLNNFTSNNVLQNSSHFIRSNINDTNYTQNAGPSQYSQNYLPENTAEIFTPESSNYGNVQYVRKQMQEILTGPSKEVPVTQHGYQTAANESKMESTSNENNKSRGTPPTQEPLTFIQAFLNEERNLIFYSPQVEVPGTNYHLPLSVDSKINALMEIVTKHLKYTILEDVNTLTHRILVLNERIAQLEYENEMLRRCKDKKDND